jgi:subtilisin family serine protease
MYRGDWAKKYMADLIACVNKKIETKRDDTRPWPKVKIAILDTGVDHKHETISGYIENQVIRGCCGFVGEIDESKEATQDTDGHGTHIAGLVARIAPWAEIYIAKVAEGSVVPYRNLIPNVRT